jgi:hypothetical protein
MGVNFAKDWPVYLLLVAVVWFFIFVIIEGNKQEKINKEAKNKEDNKTKNNS